MSVASNKVRRFGIPQNIERLEGRVLLSTTSIQSAARFTGALALGQAGIEAASGTHLVAHRITPSVLGSAAATAPTIASVSPNPVVQTGPGHVGFTITGANFQGGCTITLRDPTGVSFDETSENLASPSQQLPTTIDLSIPDFQRGVAGQWTVEVINPVGGSSGQFAFTVGASSTPTPGPTPGVAVLQVVASAPSTVIGGSKKAHGTISFVVFNQTTSLFAGPITFAIVASTGTTGSSDVPLAQFTKVLRVKSAKSKTVKEKVKIPAVSGAGTYFVQVTASGTGVSGGTSVAQSTGTIQIS